MRTYGGFSFNVTKKRADEILSDYEKLKDRFFTKQVVEWHESELVDLRSKAEDHYKKCPSSRQFKDNTNSDDHKTIKNKIHETGAEMERTILELEKVNDEVTKSKQILQETLDDITTIRQLVGPELSKYVQDVRSNRSAVEREVKTLIQNMHDLRSFFSGPHINEDLAKMNDFVRAIYNIKALSNDNMLNTIFEAMLKMQTTETKGDN